MKVLNFGSLNLDYVYSVDSFVRPGETKSSKGMNQFFGGKGFNQSIALARAGAEVCHAGNAGSACDMFRAQLRDAGVDTAFLLPNDTTCGHAIIQLDSHGQNCILIYPGANHMISHEMVDRVLAEFTPNDIVLLQNETNVTEYVIERAHADGLRIAFNPSPYDESIAEIPLEKLEWLILNEVEVQDLSGQKAEEDVVTWFRKNYPKLKVVVTLGKRGAMYIDRENVLHHPSYEVDIVDTTAAGDVFTGYFIAGQAAGDPIEKTLQTASKAAGISVSRHGAAVSAPTRDEVEKTELRLLNLNNQEDVK